MKTSIALKATLLLVFICLYSCIPKKTIAPEENELPVIFKSDTYIICTLTKDIPPALLAQKFLGDPKKAWMIEDANKKAFYHTGETIVIPLAIDNKAGLYKNGYQIVPILCYHRFSKECSSQLCVPEDVFVEQMNYLKENHYQVISMKMLMEFLEYKKALPQKSVVITIDDGYKSVYDIAFPVLKRYGFTASLFIYTNFVAGGSAMTWEQIREIKDAGFEVGSHTVSHADLAVKRPKENQKEYIQRITHEIVESKTILDNKLNQETTLLAFPFGSSNHQITAICKDAGYKAGLTVIKGGNPFFRHPFLLHRDQILSQEQAAFINSLTILQSVSLEDIANE
ncbi:MAG: polysaccharide deacetylase family protein [Proteobacteria bacterium]|nr:polysaccharide deacetylase family protein [Pseudomonadota bacterium]MBU1582073.1 polysaccharide deacetylase family protein [Pseudomonadota bacterium]MBU2455293.1 polysaccharide deacetylase family protein [Pseudomonadota bacterium]MBU2631750.1 polysaccharide deacetylase family protein [Pseudomonadota bacterium]